MTDSSAADDDDEAASGSVRDVCTMVTRLCRALLFFLLFFLLETESFFEPEPDLRGGGRRSSAVIITAVFTGVDLADEPAGSAMASDGADDVTATDDGGEFTDTTLTRWSARRLERSAAAVAGCRAVGCCAMTRSVEWTAAASVEFRCVSAGADVSCSEEWER